MRWFVRTCLMLALAFLASATVIADDKKDEKPAAAAKKPTPQVFTFPKEITLTEEQQAKLKAIQSEFGAKFAELQQKQTDLLTADQKKARSATNKANAANETKGKAARQALLAALKLTDEQKPKWDAVAADLTALRKQIEAKKAAFLTDEQKAKLPPKKAASK